MSGSGIVDVEIREGDIVTLVSRIVEESESGGTEAVNGGDGFSGDETVYFVLVDSSGTVVIDAEAATIVDEETATVSYTLDADDTAISGRFTYYWILDNLGGDGSRRRTEDQTLAIGPRADTFGDT